MTDEELVKLLATTNEQLQQALKEQSSVSNRLAEANEKMKEKFLVVMAERDEAWRRAGHAEEQWGRCEVKLATCEKYRDAYAACDRIGTEAYRELESKLEKAVEALTDLVKDCEAEYPPSHGAIKHFCLAIIAEIESSEAVTLGEKT